MSDTGSRDRWRRFKRAEAAMWHASMVYRGTGAKPADVVKAAKVFQQYFDEIYANAAPIGDAETRLAAQKKEAKEPLHNQFRNGASR